MAGKPSESLKENHVTLCSGIVDKFSWGQTGTRAIAVFASIFAEKGYFKKLIRFPIPIITFALIGGGLGSILTWALYGLSFGEGISAPLAHQIYNTGTFSVFWAQFFADMLIDLGDKIITVLFTALVLHLLPQTFLDSFYYSGWQQAPMSKYAKAGKEDGPKNRISLRTKITLLVAVGLIITGAGVTLVSFIHFRNAAIEEQTLMAKGIAYLAADLVKRLGGFGCRIIGQLAL